LSKEEVIVYGHSNDGRGDKTAARQAEDCCYRYLLVGGSMVLVGLVLMLTAVLFWLGAPLAAIGAALIGGNMIWFLRLRKQQGMEVTCPSCDKSYTVLPGFGSFICSECRHTVPVRRAA
jgi:hypothetical protein